MSPSDVVYWIINLFKRDTELKRRIEQMAVDLTNLQNAVVAVTGATQSAITELQKLAAEVANLPTVDPVALQTMTDTLNGNAKSITDALAAIPK